MAITILHKNRVTATVKVTGTGSQTITLASLALADETVTTPMVDIHAVKFSATPTAKTVVTRNSLDALALTGTGDWEFNGYSVSENNTFDIIVNSTDTNATTIIVLRKVQGYVGPDHQTLGYIK